MRNLGSRFFLTLALISSTTAAFGQGVMQQPQRSGTPEEQAACNRDVQSHCRSVISQGDL